MNTMGWKASWKAWCMAAAPAALLAILPFPGTVALRLTLLAITVVTAAVMWRRLAPPPLPCKLPTGLLIAMALWAGVALLSVPWSFDPRYSLGEVKNEIGYTLLAFVGFYVQALDTTQARRMLAGLGAGAVIMLGGAFILQHGQRIWAEDAFIGGSGAFASYLATVLPVAVAPLMAGRRQVAMWVVLGLLLVAGYLSGQKIFIAVAALQLLAMFWLLGRGGLIRFSRGQAAVLSLAGVILAGAMLTQMLLNRANNYGPLHENIVQDVRLRQWPKVAEQVMLHPLVGSGFGRDAMRRTYPELIPPDVPLFWHAHNVFLNYGLSMGLPGIIALLLVFGSLMREFWRLCPPAQAGVPLAQRVVGAAGFAMVVGVVARNVTNDMFVRDSSLLFWALAGLLLGWGRRLAASSGTAPQVQPA